MMMMTNKNSVQEFIKNKCNLIGIVASKPFVLSDGKELVKVDTYRPYVGNNEYSFENEGKVDTFLVMTWGSLHSHIVENDVVQIEGAFDYLSLNLEKYGYCPICGEKQEISDLKNIPVIRAGDAGQKVLYHANNYSDGMKKLKSLDAYKKENGWLSKIYFEELPISSINIVHDGSRFFRQQSTIYRAKIGKHTLIMAHNGFDLVVEKQMKCRDEYKYLETDKFSGTVRNVLAYIGMPWDFSCMEFCKNCNAIFKIDLPEPIFFFKEEPVVEDLKVLL